jgi:hypothetical protein
MQLPPVLTPERDTSFVRHPDCFLSKKHVRASFEKPGPVGGSKMYRIHMRKSLSAPEPSRDRKGVGRHHPESNADLQEFAPLLRQDGVWIWFP